VDGLELNVTDNQYGRLF